MLSSLDGQQVEEQLKVAERRLGDVERRLQRKLHLVQTTNGAFDNVAADVAQTRQWIAERAALVAEKEPLGFRTKTAESKMFQIKVIIYI